VESFIQSAGIDTEVSDAVGLVLNEALANIIRHGYEGATDKPIHVKVEQKDNVISLQIRDWGKTI